MGRNLFLSLVWQSVDVGTLTIGVSKVITELRPTEAVKLDHGRIIELGVRLGPIGADDLISRSMEDLAVLLSRLQKAYRTGRMRDLRDLASSVEKTARSVGMTSLAQVAQDVQHLAMSLDATSLGATTSRLTRIGEMSLMAVWELSDVSL